MGMSRPKLNEAEAKLAEVRVLNTYCRACSDNHSRTADSYARPLTNCDSRTTDAYAQPFTNRVADCPPNPFTFSPLLR